MPKVSVIVPNYNHAKYLKQRIESVLNQTHPDLELILMDDCSTDDSLAALERYRLHPKVSKLLVNRTNSGSPFNQWNRGVREAVGDYIWIAESDDYADPRFLEKLLPVLERNPRAGLVYCQSWCVDEAGGITGDLNWWTQSLDVNRWRRDFTNQGQHEVGKYLLYKNTIPNASAVIFRKSIFDQAGGARPDLTMCGDWLTWVKMLLVSDLGFVAQSLNYFRYHSASTRTLDSFFRQRQRFQEEYSVKAFILSRIPVDNRTKASAFNPLFTAWINTFKTKEVIGKEAKQLRTAAAAIDLGLTLVYFRYFANKLKHRFSVR